MSSQKSIIDFDDLYKRKYNDVINMCKKFSKESEEEQDMAQEIFMNVLKGMVKFKGDSHVDTWLFAITRNYCYNYARAKKAKKRRGYEISLNKVMESVIINRTYFHEEILEDKNSPEPLENILSQEKCEQILNCVEELTTKQQQLLYTFMNNRGIIYDEVAKILKIPANTVRSRLSRTRNNLRKIIKRHKIEI